MLYDRSVLPLPLPLPTPNGHIDDSGAKDRPPREANGTVTRVVMQRSDVFAAVVDNLSRH